MISNMPPDDTQPDTRGYVLPSSKRVLLPLPTSQPAADNAAVDLIRRKLDALFSDEPPAAEEQQEATHAIHRSKHQEYMYQLTVSGRSLADIQTQWHSYYEQLPDAEKHEVWQEFYSAHAMAKNDKPARLETAHSVAKILTAEEVGVSNAQQAVTDSFGFGEPAGKYEHQSQLETSTMNDKVFSVPSPSKLKPHLPAEQPAPETAPARPIVEGPKQTVNDIREELIAKVRSRNKPTKKQHSQSLIFGLSMGLVVVAVLSFGFFNERFIAPFITPSRAVSSTPLIIDPSTAAVGSDPKIIIPKINVEIPVVYDVGTIEESAVEAGLERGVVHYATTPLPGEKGNGVIFGHSANNILNKGKYKFAFVLLRKLDINDTFYIQKDGKRYVYRIYEKKIVPPTDISVLNPNDKPATFTLITCDPPGTSLNRLIIVGEQISPDPNANAASTAQPESATPQVLPSNSPTLWSRLTGWVSN